MQTHNFSGWQEYTSIDNIDYVPGIGNRKDCADNPGFASGGCALLRIVDQPDFVHGTLQIYREQWHQAWAT